MDSQLDCSFIFGRNNSTVETFDISILRNAEEVKSRNIFNSKWYRLSGIIRKTKNFDVIIDDMGIICTTSWLLSIVSRIRRQKVLLWSHGWYGREGVLKKYMKRLYSALTDGMFVYGRYAHDLMLENGFNGNKLHVIHNSLDYDTEVDIRKSLKASDIYTLHFNNNYPVLIMIGRLNKRKHLYLLIEALEILQNRGEKYNAVIIGDGEEKQSLQELAISKGVSKEIWFYGPCYDEQTNAELLYNADMCVVPGDIGLTAIHSMTFGCPCITHNYFPNQGPEFEAIVPNITGDFYEFGDKQSLSDVISNWFAHHKNDREGIRCNCYKEIESNWNPHRQIEIINSVLKDL